MMYDVLDMYLIFIINILPNIITPSTEICCKHQMNVVLGLIFGYETRFNVRYDLMFPRNTTITQYISPSVSYPLTFIKMSNAHLKYQQSSRCTNMRLSFRFDPDIFS